MLKLNIRGATGGVKSYVPSLLSKFPFDYDIVEGNFWPILYISMLQYKCACFVSGRFIETSVAIVRRTLFQEQLFLFQNNENSQFETGVPRKRC